MLHSAKPGATVVVGDVRAIVCLKISSSSEVGSIEVGIWDHGSHYNTCDQITFRGLQRTIWP